MIIDIADLIADAEDDPAELTITAASSANGDVAINGTELTFTPTPDFSGDAEIAYTVTDSGGLTASKPSPSPSIGQRRADAGRHTRRRDRHRSVRHTVDLGGLDLADIDTNAGFVTLESVGERRHRARRRDRDRHDADDPGRPRYRHAGVEVFANDGALDSAAAIP